ncbi:unnamed protein product [Prunus armeniaca]
MLSWSITSVRPAILAHSRAFPGKNKGKPHFICFKKEWFLLLKLSETCLLLPPLLPLAWLVKKMPTSVLSTRVDAVDEMMADAMEQADQDAEGITDQANVEEAVTQRCPTGASE